MGDFEWTIDKIKQALENKEELEAKNNDGMTVITYALVYKN